MRSFLLSIVLGRSCNVYKTKSEMIQKPASLLMMEHMSCVSEWKTVKAIKTINITYDTKV